LAAHRAGNWSGAIQHYREATRLDPGLVSAWFNLGLAYKRRGQRVEARDALKEALRLKPDMTEARFMLGVVYRELGMPTQAVAALEQVRREAPGHVKAHFVLGLLYRDAQQYDIARRRLLVVIRDDPMTELAGRARQVMKELR
jgi:tetratricopeptide (TPR) repeat protein